MIDIIPGILEEDISEVTRKVKLVAAHVSQVHLDIADKTLVANTTVSDPVALGKLIAAYPHLSFEAHLMVASPEKYIRSLVAAGFKRLIAHVEAADPRVFLDEAKLESAEVGIAIDGPTELEQIEPFLEEIDMVLVMSAEVGLHGQPFLPESIEKVRAIRKHFVDLPIEVEGGITGETARVVKDAGATRLVATTALFQSPGGAAQAIDVLKNA